MTTEDLVDMGPWYQVREAAPMMGLGVSTLRRMCQAREIECKAVPGASKQVSRYMVSQATIRAFNRRTLQKATRGL